MTNSSLVCCNNNGKCNKDIKNNNVNGSNNCNGIRDKIFQPQNSMLTEMHNISTYRSVHHLYIAMLIVFLLNNIVAYTFGSSNVILCFHVIASAFTKFHIAIVFWIILFSFMLLVYPIFNFWAKIRNDINLKLVNVWDRIWFIIFILVYLFFLYLPFLMLNESVVALGTRGAIVGEQLRFTMKYHAFVRSNASKVLSHKIHSDDTNPVPSFSKYIYFLFAPTFVYQDSYPRTTTIRWSFVLSSFMEFISCILYLSIIVSEVFIPKYNSYPHESQTLQKTIIYAFSIMPVSVVFFVISIFSVLHPWCNAWAELLQFADRQFYSDWWNASTYSTFYRKWNDIVQNFIHKYIYKDVYEILTPGNKVAAACIAITVSSLFHEYIFIVSFGFFYPIITLQFVGAGMILYFLEHNWSSLGNIFIWLSLTIGNGIIIALFLNEYSARAYCPKRDNIILDYFIPRSWSPC